MPCAFDADARGRLSLALSVDTPLDDDFTARNRMPTSSAGDMLLPGLFAEANTADAADAHAPSRCLHATRIAD